MVDSHSRQVYDTSSSSYHQVEKKTKKRTGMCRPEEDDYTNVASHNHVIKRIFFFYFFLFVLLVCVELSLFLLLVEEKVTTQGGRAHLCDWWKVANTRTPYLVCVQTLDELVDVFSYLKENQIIFFFYCQ